MESAESAWKVDRRFFWLTAALIALPIFDSVAQWDWFLGLTDEQGESTGVGYAFKLIWLPPIGAAFWILAQRRRVLAALLPYINLPLLITLAWMLLSSVWAPDPGAAFRQAFSIAGITIIAIAVTLASWTSSRFDRIFEGTGLAIMLASLFAALLMPIHGIQPEDQFELRDSWRGITYQKNGLGQLSSIMLIYSFHAWAVSRQRFSRVAPSLLLSLLLIFKSRSSTSLLAAMISCGILALMLRPPARAGELRPIIWVGGWFILLGCLFFYLIVVGSPSPDSFAAGFGSLFGKDATFSGRTYIWHELLLEIPKHPWLGVGFNSFWGPPGSSLSDPARIRLKWLVPAGHNGYLDLINTVGLIGFTFFMGFLIRHLRDLFRVLLVDRGRAALHFAIFFFVVVENLTETGWFSPIQFTHVVAMFSSLTVSRILWDAHLKASRIAFLQSESPRESSVPSVPGEPLRG